MLDESKIEQFVLLAKGLKGKPLLEIIANATSEPGLFGFGELLALPQIQEIGKGEDAPHYHLLQLFAYGTYPEYASAAPGVLPPLSPAQVSKLKQLTVVSLALQQKVLSYASLQKALQIDSVRGLEDFLITECFYAGILKGKLDQKAGCVQVHDVVGRDVRPDQVTLLEQGFNNWLGAAESILSSIEQRINEAVTGSQAAQAKAQAAAAKVEEMKKVVKIDLDTRTSDMMLDEVSNMDYNMEEERMDRPMHPFGGMREGFLGGGDRTDRSERRAVGSRSKKRIQR